MGEIDTDPIKSVQASLSHFGQKFSHINSRSTSDDESEKEKDVESLLKDLANYKVQLEVKDSEHKQALLKQHHYEKTIDRLSSLLKTSQFEKDSYNIESIEASVCVSELEFKIKQMVDKLSETSMIQKQLSHVLTELNSTQAELLRAKTLLVDSTDAKLEAMRETELMETALTMEKVKIEELLNHVAELNETILHLRISSMEAANAKAEADEERLEKENLDQANYIELLERELTQLKMELKDANEEVKMVVDELEAMKSEVREICNRENEAQVEIALLRGELHKGRSKTAAAEAAELRAKGEKSAAYFALQQLAMEVEEAKKENQRLKSEHFSSEETPFDHSKSKSKEEEETPFEDSKSNDGEEGTRDCDDDKITIPREEYEILVKKAEKADDFDSNMDPKSQQDMEILKKDMESAIVRVREFRARAEQAATRAEVAEQAKLVLEEQIMRWKEHKQRRRAALAALREESMSKSSYSFEYNDNPKAYQPLGKFLRMKF